MTTAFEEKVAILNAIMRQPPSINEEQILHIAQKYKLNLHNPEEQFACTAKVLTEMVNLIHHDLCK